MSTVTIRWKRSRDNHVESRCGRWRIVPNYAGTTRAQDYQLWWGDRMVARMEATQRDAKATAHRLVNLT